jgi:glycosyltransferase involved in cell wall biosynthesis
VSAVQPRGEVLYLDVNALLTPHLTGLGRFVASLLPALADLTPLRLVHDGPDGRREVPVTAEGLPPRDVDVHAWVKRVLALPPVEHDPEEAHPHPILHTFLCPPVRRHAREMVVLYDFTPVLLPWTHTLGVQQAFWRFCSIDSALCEKAFAISRCTRADAAWLTRIPAEDVLVTYPGPSQCVEAHAWPGRVARKAQRILVVSTLEPRKNAAFLYDWFQTTKVLEPGVELWWAGPKGWLVDSATPAGGGSRPIRFLGMVSDAELCRLYREATFTIYPSLYEGFGFPVLDSLLHGAPVACSGNSSLLELDAPGVFYFDPADHASLDDACRRLLDALPMNVDGEALRQRFSWDEVARTIVGQAFEAPAGEPGRFSCAS